jgi:hypothetical protein
MRATDALNLAHNEAVKIWRSQLLQAQRPASEPLMEKAANDRQIGHHRCR